MLLVCDYIQIYSGDIMGTTAQMSLNEGWLGFVNNSPTNNICKFFIQPWNLLQLLFQAAT